MISLIGSTGVTALPGYYVAASVPQPLRRGAALFARRSNGTSCLITLRGSAFTIETPRFEPDWVYLGIRSTDGAVLAKEDAECGSSVAAIRPGERKRSAGFVLNRHLCDVATPARRELRMHGHRGDERKGVLQLPVGHVAGVRHPVIVWAYPDQEPVLDGPMTRINHIYAVWFHLQYLLSRGFAVFHAPLATTHSKQLEPFEIVASEVLPWLDVLSGQPEILPGEYGFFGHSYGGYVALALEALTARFKAIAAYAAFPDLAANSLSAYGANMALACAGAAIQADRFYFEDARQPFTFRAPFWAAQEKWLRNSPLYRMGSATTPLLLIEGEFDGSPRPVESVYSILHGRGVPVEMAYYWGEGHVIDSPGNLKDLWLRTERFFRKYLRVSS